MRVLARVLSIAMAVATLATLIVPSPALASSKGRRNTAIVLGALTVHQALKHKTGNALLLGAGTAYSYKRYQDARKAEKRRKRTAYVTRSRRTLASRRYRTR